RTHLYRLTGVDLTRIDGIDAPTARKVVAETGLDMRRWPSDKHFASWADPRAGHEGLRRQDTQRPHQALRQPGSGCAPPGRGLSAPQQVSARRLLPAAQAPPWCPESHHRHRPQARSPDLPHAQVRHRLRRPGAGILRAPLPDARALHPFAPRARTRLHPHQDAGPATRAERSLTRSVTWKGLFALRPYQPSARRVYQPAALPERGRSILTERP